MKIPLSAWFPTLCLGFLLSSLFSPEVLAQYSIAPSAITITYPERHSEIIVRMMEDAPTMVFSVSSFFAIPEPDSSGQFHLVRIDSNQVQNIASDIRCSPRRFQLSAGQEQIIRISIQDAALLSEGEYWSRVMISAMTHPVQADPLQLAVSISMGLEVRTISGLIFRKGSVHTGLEVTEAATTLDQNILWTHLQLKKRGNAAWIGTVEQALYNTKGEVVHRDRSISNVYRDRQERLKLVLPSLPPDNYTLKIRYVSEREDPMIKLLKTPPVIQTFNIPIGLP
jgi:hypothetical protein